MIGLRYPGKTQTFSDSRDVQIIANYIQIIMRAEQGLYASRVPRPPRPRVLRTDQMISGQHMTIKVSILKLLILYM